MDGKHEVAMERNGADGGAAREAIEGARHADEARRRAEEATARSVRSGIEAATENARRLGDDVTRAMGVTGEEAEMLAGKSRDNIEAMSRGGTVIALAYQDMGRHVLGLAQEQMRSGLDGMNRLAGCKSIQEFTAVQSDLVRDGMRRCLDEGRELSKIAADAVAHASGMISGGYQHGTPAQR